MDNQTKLQLFSTAATGIFAGAAVYINLVEHPARLECGSNAAHQQWLPSFKRAKVMQSSLVAMTFVTTLTNYLLHKESQKAKLSLIAGMIMASLIPFTIVAIYPTNNKLLDQKSNLSEEEKNNLLVKWGYLHSVRSVISLVAFGLLLKALTEK